MCALLLLVWGVWCVRARLPIYATSEQARVESGRAAVPIAAPVGGRLRRLAVRVGQRVAAGDLLAELDAEVEFHRLAEARALLEAEIRQLAALEEARAARSAGDEAGRRSFDLSRAQATEQSRGAAAAADEAAERLQRLERLAREGVVSPEQVDAARAEAERRAGQAREARLAERRVPEERARETADRAAGRAEMERQIAERRGDLEARSQAVVRLVAEGRWRTLRAPAAGRIGELAALAPGALLVAGERIGALVPDGALRVRGEFPAGALGRIRPGQTAELRLDAFPWPEAGVVSARVEQVASELRDGKIRVDLTLLPSRIRLEHGWTGTVLIETERLSPLSLLLRSLGRRVAPSGSGAGEVR